ncbi:DUF262 domain-containing protein [Iodobacter sp. LRB]|uniref:DUF262 domain-containing protein n=1 Tax=unclassified Iodobacter TaxID=235634 RepID=UPI000C0E3DE0|nr:DUF262 domain-containing protein [Iodobacter sp. BJB302]PHV01513.1 hypothetical protein CSQ88_11745 [Iodobacter sp. BJB302]
MSNIEINAVSGEQLSFYQLFEQKNMQVEIPIIQRDYAQGRAEVAEVRDTFLQALHRYLEKGQPFRDLDFVYGSITNKADGRGSFTPLDGQQRLTTLFLLHWYLAQIAGEGASFRQVLSAGGVSHFTYETRSSSREFCNALVAKDIDFSALLQESGTGCLSKTIKDRAWFYLSWESDPTIRSMLTMLDAIHQQFAGHADFFYKLIDQENPVITFRFLNLAEFKLTDDLYIKMNARGKPLTHFENFKARLEKVIKSFKATWPEYHLSFKASAVSGYDYFIHKIDTDWADLFWHYRNVASQDESYDDELMNFISLSIANFLLLNPAQNNENLPKTLFGQGGKTNQLSFIECDRNGYLSQPLIIELITRLDLLRGASSPCAGIAMHLQKNSHYDEENVFKKIIANNSSYPEKLRFHAFYTALAKGKAGAELEAWMRVIYNLTENTIFNSVDDYHKALVSVHDLAQMEGTILNLLIQDVQVQGFLPVQIFEEKLKAHLLLKSSEWETAIIQLEGHEFFRGQIGYALKFSGIVDYFNQHKNLEWRDAEEKNYFEQFKYYANCGSALFSAIAQSSEALDFAWERAVLAKGDYLTSTTADRFNLLSTRTIKGNIDRDHSWRRLLRLPLDESSVWHQRQLHVKAVFDDPLFDIHHLKSGLEKICSKVLIEKPLNWQSMLIARHKLFSLCNQGFIVRNSEEVVLLHESQRNHYHSELYSKYLELELKESQSSTAPFKNKHYNSVRSSDERASLILDGFCANKQLFGLNIFFMKEQYHLLFYRTHDQAIPFPSALQEVLVLCGFCVMMDLEAYPPQDWLCTNEDYVYRCKDTSNAIAKITELCSQLEGLSDEQKSG